MPTFSAYKSHYYSMRQTQKRVYLALRYGRRIGTWYYLTAPLVTDRPVRAFVCKRCSDPFETLGRLAEHMVRCKDDE